MGSPGALGLTGFPRANLYILGFWMFLHFMCFYVLWHLRLVMSTFWTFNVPRWLKFSTIFCKLPFTFSDCNILNCSFWRATLKGQCQEIFCFWFFYESVSPQPQSVPLGPFRIFSKSSGDIGSSRLTTGVADTGGKWKKSSIRKILIILLGHLWIVELTYI